jgi:short-subunit dehydrogenase
MKSLKLSYPQFPAKHVSTLPTNPYSFLYPRTTLMPNRVLITGPSEGGLGAQAAISLATGKPKEIILAGRNKSKIQPVIDHIQENHPEVLVHFMELDLADLPSVRAAAKEINSKIEKLDVLINNAGGKISLFRLKV